MRILITVAVATLVACSQSAAPIQQPARTPAATAPAAPAFVMSCTDASVFNANTTGASLVARFGAANVTLDTMIDGPEGEQERVTLLFPNDDTRSATISWRNPEAQTGFAGVSVQTTNSLWRGPSGIAIGAPIADIERINGRAFQLYGFGWDYGGLVSSWNSGALAANEPACVFGASFDETGDGSTAVGDGGFSSDSAAMRAARPRLGSMSLRFADPPAE